MVSSYPVQFNVDFPSKPLSRLSTASVASRYSLTGIVFLTEGRSESIAAAGTSRTEDAVSSRRRMESGISSGSWPDDTICVPAEYQTELIDGEEDGADHKCKRGGLFRVRWLGDHFKSLPPTGPSRR